VNCAPLTTNRKIPSLRKVDPVIGIRRYNCVEDVIRYLDEFLCV
jgi:hypothetical protein